MFMPKFVSNRYIALQSQLKNFKYGFSVFTHDKIETILFACSYLHDDFSCTLCIILV